MLYKYMAPERTEFLQNRSLRFTPHTLLNDPFECRFTVNPRQDEKARAVDDDYVAEWALVEDLLQNTIGQLGMLCLSKNPENILMWSHYAREHRGYVVALDESHEFFSAVDVYYIDPIYQTKVRIPNRGFGTLRDVRYTHQRPNIEYGDYMPLDAFFTKSSDWSYEEEVRIFRRCSEADTVTGDSQTAVSLFHLPDGVVKKIIIGAEASNELKAQISDAARSSRFHGVTIQRARTDRRNYSLRFDQT